jgi:hypothetical protein
MTAIEEIRKIYFAASRASIVEDLDRAIDLLKSIESVEERERATVFMQGLAEMKSQWSGHKNKKKRTK